MIRHNTAYVEYDRELERRVREYLTGRQMPTLRKIEVAAHEGTVTLCGEVQSFYQKQLCLNCCRRVDGVRDLIDKVEVASHEQDWLV
jgi:osmotically-inducible protein OsmY